MYFVVRSLDSKKQEANEQSQPPQEEEWKKRSRLWEEEKKRVEEIGHKAARINDLAQHMTSIIEPNFDYVHIETDGNTRVDIMVNGEREMVKFNLLQTDIRQETGTESDGTKVKYAVAQVHGHHLRLCRVSGDDDIFFKLFNEYKNLIEERMLGK